MWRSWVTCWVANDAQYARMVEYSAAHNTLAHLEDIVTESSRALLVSAAGSLGP